MMISDSILDAATTLSALSKVGTGQPIPIDFFPQTQADRRASFNTGYVI